MKENMRGSYIKIEKGEIRSETTGFSTLEKTE